MAGITTSFVAGGAAGPAAGAPVQAGVVSGSSITFNNITIPANAAVSFTITNIKINASQIANEQRSSDGSHRNDLHRWNQRHPRCASGR